MNTLLFLMLFGDLSKPGTLLFFWQNSRTAAAPAVQSERVRELTQDVIRSGRVLRLTPKLEEGVRIAPGAPPVLAFRYLEGRERGRFGGLDLVLDDAGH